MTRAEMLTLLESWQERMQDAEERMGEVYALFGCEPESPLPSSVHALMGCLTTQVAERCGFAVDWLEAWWMEHNFGERPMQAGLVGEPMREIRTLSELLDLVVDDMDAADAEAVAAMEDR